MSEIRPGDVDTVFAFGRTTFYQVRSWLVKATDMNVHPTRNRNFAIHVAWTFMSEIRTGDFDTVIAFGRTTFYQVRSWLVKATDMNVHPTRNRNFAIHEAWTFMSEIRTGDFDTVIAFGRTTVFPGAKLVGEGDGHECPSGMRIQRFCQSPVQFGLVFSS